MTLTDLINRLEKATNDLDHSHASNAVRRLLVDFRALDQPAEDVFEIVPIAPRRYSVM